MNRFMWQQTRTVRFHLSCLYLCVFGAILAVVCLLIMTLRDRDLRADFDERLLDRAEAIVDALGSTSEGSEVVSLQHLDRSRLAGYWWQVVGGDDTAIDRSAGMGAAALPLSPRARATRRTGRPEWETVRIEALMSDEPTDDAIRLLTVSQLSPGVAPLYVQVARGLGPVHESAASLRRLLLMLVSGGLLAAAGASWYLAGHSLAPIRRIAEQARSISANRLDDRIEMPPGNDEIAFAVATINEMLDRLAAAFRAQDRFVADVSHELKTPLTVLLGETQVLMQRTRSPREYDRFLASVQDEVRSLAQIVDSLLALARADAGIAPASLADVSINEVVTDAIQRWQPQADQREVRLVPMLALPADDGPQLLVSGDGDLLRLMVGNLLRNAIRFSPPDQPVEVEVSVADGQACIAVRDCGPGIPPEHLERIFDRFYRAPKTLDAFEGTGLGLAIVRGVARLHGGTIDGRNSPDQGAEFVITLPLKPSPS